MHGLAAPRPTGSRSVNFESQSAKRLPFARTAAVGFDAAALGKFAVLYADPPWRYESGTTDGDRAIENHYPTLSLEEICALPVSDIAHVNAVLFLWVIAPKLDQRMGLRIPDPTSCG